LTLLVYCILYHIYCVSVVPIILDAHPYFAFCPGVGGTPRPIELHSHDPLRYVGDMLAWLHQAAATEKEHLLTVLKRCESMKYSFYLCRTLQNENIFFDLPFNYMYRHFTCLPFHQFKKYRCFDLICMKKSLALELYCHFVIPFYRNR